MSRLFRVLVAGFVSLAAMSVGSAVQAQTTIETIFFAGVVGDPILSPMPSEQGTTHTFSGPLPSVSSVVSSPLWNAAVFQLRRSLGNADDNITTLEIYSLRESTAPYFQTSTFEYREGTTVVGTGDVYAVVFSTAVHRDAFIYYLQQRLLAETETEYGYFTTLGAYEFWMGQENEGLALYSYYTGMASYLRDTASDPRQGMYDYWYNIGLGAYYYFEGIGDSDSAWLAFVYYVGLANEALNEDPLP